MKIYIVYLHIVCVVYNKRNLNRAFIVRVTSEQCLEDEKLKFPRIWFPYTIKIKEKTKHTFSILNSQYSILFNTIMLYMLQYK